MTQTITKDQFRTLANTAVESLMSMFDDVWEIGYPMAMITMKRDSDGNTVRVVVGIEEIYNGKTDDDH